MKKLLASLLVLAMCAPAMAVQFGLIGGTDGTATITMNTEGAVVRGVAIKVTSVGALDIDVAIVNPDFNCFIDYAYANTSTYAVVAGHPFALDGAAGVAADGATTYVISMGVLDQDGLQAGFNGSGNLIQFNVGDGQVCIAADTLRGPESGVVGDTTLTSNIASVACVTVSSGPTSFILTTASAGNGTVAPATGPQPANQLATITATPNANYYFWKWTGSAVTASTAASTTIMMDADKSVTANFTLSCQKYNVTKEVGGTDNICNVNDLNALIAWVNLKKNNPAIFAVPSSDPDYNVAVNGTTYGLVYNITKKEGGTDNTVNVNDLNSLINYVNKRKAALFSVNCATCGC